MQIALLLLAAAAAPHFKVQSLAVEGDVISISPADLDGDGKKDLLAVYTTGLPPYRRRFFAVFWNRNGVFAPRPDLVMPVDENEACAFDVGGGEILMLTPRGVWAHAFPGRHPVPPRKVLEQPTIFHQAIEGQLPRLKMLQDVAGPNSRELLVPSLGTLGIWKRGPAGYEKTAEIEVDLEVNGSARNDAVEVRYGFPSLHIADADGDGLRDIFATQEDRVAIYRQGPGLTFHPQPDFTRDFSVRTPAEHRARGSSATVMVADLDGDGAADLVVRKQIFQGVTSAESTSYVFFGTKGALRFAREPAQVLLSEGIGLLQTQLLDVTGDGRPDLIVPYTSFGVFALIRMLTAKTARVDLQVFPFEARGRRFAPEPVSERPLKLRIPLAGDSDLQAVSVSADVTGDGKPDLIYGAAEDELDIYPSLGGGEFALEPAEAVAVRSAGVLDAVDLDGKGRSDLILSYPQTSGHRGEIMVLVNTGAW